MVKLCFFCSPNAHAPEVLADKVVEKGLGGVAVGKVVLLHDLVRQVGTGLKGKVLAEA